MISDITQQQKIRMMIKENFFTAQLFKVWAFDKVELVGKGFWSSKDINCRRIIKVTGFRC